MTIRSLRQPRRGAGMLPILLLVIGVVMLVLGIAIGRELGKSGQEQANATTAINPTANTTEAKEPAPADASDESVVADGGMSEEEAAEEAARRLYEQQRDQDHEHGQTPQATAGAAPPVVFEPAMLDFGTVAPGRIVTGTVHIRNVGDEPLLIEASQPSCSCTAVDMSNTWIQPGEAVPMDATFTKETLGEKKAAVRLKFQGYDEIASVELMATVAMQVMADPAYIYAEFDGDTRRTQVHSGQFSIRSLDKKPFRILAINGQPPSYINFDPETDEPQSVYQLNWDLSDVDDRTCRRADGSKLRRYWVVETDHPDCPVFDMQVRHLCTIPEALGNRRWVITPQRVLIGEMRPGESIDVDVLMKWLPRSSHNEEVYTVLSESPLLDVEVLSFHRARGDGDEDTVRLRVTVSEDHPEGLLYEKTRVHTGSNSAPLLILGRVGG